jgi:ElaB/YqjD/DUF883 family membrane-anchored ribosome-binding protein
MSAALDMATAGNGVFPVSDAVGREFAELFDGVDDLIHRVAHADSPEILKLRARVYASMVAARNAVEHNASHALVSATRIGDSDEDSLADFPGHEFSVALLVGLGLGLIASLRREG